MKHIFFLVFGLLVTGSAFAQPNITAAEYFFDTDPGPGNGVSIPVSAGTTIDISNLNIPTNGLPVGTWHTLCVRVKDANNVWGFYECRKIYIREPVVIPPVPPVEPITAMEFFYNTDNGLGTGTVIPITPGLTVDVVNTNLSNSLPSGWHTLHVRTKNNANVWGFYESRKIYVREPVVIIPPPLIEPITAMEYFYNTDNGPGTGTAITVTPGTSVDIVNTNLANALPEGWHTVSVRAKNNANTWGFYESRKIFIRGVSPPSPPGASPIVELEYFVDADPGAGLSSTKVTINPALATVDLVDEPLNVGTQSLGAHKIYIRAKNQAGEWSMNETASFSVIASCPILTAPSATGLARCDAGSVTLTAPGASAGETYRWYATNTSLTPLFTGNPYTTASLNVNTTFYVTTYNPTTYCESARTPVTAEISGIAKPLLSISGSLSVCEGTTQVVTAPSGFSSYTWSNGLTTQQITVTTSGSYSVVVNNGICSSPPSDAFVFTVNSKPAKPPITATNGGSLCGTSSVMLSAPIGFTSYSWSTGETTQSINVSSVGNHVVTVTNAAGCQSVVSDVFAVTTSLIGKPTVSITGNTALCNNSTVDLSAPSGFTNYTWSNGATTQNITVSVAGNYSVSVANGACASPASDAVAITTTAPPAKPTIQITGSTSLCNGAFVILTVPSGFVNYVWSNGETARQIVVSAAGNYSVQVGSASNCLSVSSDVVSVTLTGAACGSNSGPILPPAPSVTGGSNCGTGAVMLSASGATAGLEYRWYDVAVGGSSLSSTATYKTDSLTQTTDFYVAIFDPVISVEGLRTKATASIITLAKPTLTPTGTFSICAGTSTLITAPGGFAQYRWRNNGALLNTANQRLSVAAAGSYTVETSDGVCFSEPSDPVTINVDAAESKPTVTGNATICGSGTTTLTASAGVKYLWSNNETTQSITVSAGTYSVNTINGACSSPASEVVIVKEISVPSKPVISVVGKEFICGGSVVALTAPNGFTNYKWSSGETTQTILVDKAGKYSVQTGMASNCLSSSSDDIDVKLGTTSDCGLVITPDNRAPVIQAATFAVEIQSIATYPLTGLISDENNNLDISTLRILDVPNNNGKASGGQASLDNDNNIRLDYKGINFSGKESVTLQVCDTEGVCSQQVMMIDVVGNVLVYNGVTPDGDGYNDFMLIQFIDIIDEAKKNKVSILDRWGEVVFDMENYNNIDRVFTGNANGGGELPAGTYLYKVNLASGKTYTGFITLKR